MPPSSVCSPDKWAIITYFILVAMGVTVHIIDRVRRREVTGRTATIGKGIRQRLLDFIEQPLFLVVVSIIGGILGVLVYTPVFLVCDVCVILALHRSKAVADKGAKTQVFWYSLVFLITSFILWGVGVSLRKSGRNLVHDLALAVAESMKENTKGQPTQVIQVVPTAPSPPPPPPRSYLVFDGTMRFGERRDNLGNLQADQNLRVGDELFFNYYFNPTGPNPILIDGHSALTKLEPDFSRDTQKRVIEYFKAEVKKEKKEHGFSPSWSTLMPQDKGHWNTAYAWTDDFKQHQIITKSDLDELTSFGTKIAFVLVEIAYKDNGKLHHLRTCQFLQPPATAPGVWHYCDQFINSD